MWGLKEDEIKWAITPVQRSKKEWYIYDYSLNYTREKCGNSLYFNASGYSNKSIIWSPELKVECKILCYLSDITWMLSQCEF